MESRIRRICVCLVGCAVFSLVAISAETASAQTGRYPRVIARGSDREVIKSTPIELRPRRPLHFYGNSVRRNYYRSDDRGNRGASTASRGFFGNLGTMGQGLTNWVTNNRFATDEIR